MFERNNVSLAAFQTYFKSKDARPILRIISSRSKYPINSFEELSAPFGGQAFLNRAQELDSRFAEANSIFSPSFFPITSEADLQAKLTLITTPGKLITIPPDSNPPVSPEQLKNIKGSNDLGGLK